MIRSQSNSTSLIPLFPLPIVLLPGGYMPLHIFEPRYRLMLKHVVEGQNEFGIVLATGVDRFAEIGCTAEVKKVETLPDGRSNILTFGSRRFKVTDVFEDKPYLTANVESLDDPKPTPAGVVCAKNVRAAILDIFQLSGKLRKTAAPTDVPEDATELCYWVAHNFYASAEMRQDVLQSASLDERLGEQYLWLDEQRRILRARSAIEDAFC